MNVFYNVRVIACTDRDVKEEVYITCKKIKKKPILNLIITTLLTQSSVSQKEKETHIKYNHCQMTHTTIFELKVINKKYANI